MSEPNEKRMSEPNEKRLLREVKKLRQLLPKIKVLKWQDQMTLDDAEECAQQIEIILGEMGICEP